MNRKFPVEFAYQVFALITAVIVVHGMYTLVIRPKAEVIRAQQLEQIAADENYVPERSPYILIKDLEQEMCFILMLWAMAIMAYKAVLASREGKLLERDLIPLKDGVSILPEDTRSYSRTVQEFATAATQPVVAARSSQRTSPVSNYPEYSGCLDRRSRPVRG